MTITVNKGGETLTVEVPDGATVAQLQAACNAVGLLGFSGGRALAPTDPAPSDVTFAPARSKQAL